MRCPPRVLCMMDLAGAGRCSLAVVLPVLAACGVQGCPLPPVLLPAHTGGFAEVPRKDIGAYARQAAAFYQKEQITFEAVYIGYLAGAAQFDLAEELLAQYPAAYKLVDPVLGDSGRLYQSFTPDMVLRMRALCGQADLITPNLTESALLLGEDPLPLPPAPDVVQQRLQTLAANGQAVLLTGIPLPENKVQVAGRMPQGPPFTLQHRLFPENYPGTGDLFAAAVLGLLLRGLPLWHAAAQAADFLESAIEATHTAGAEVRHGVWFEPFLPQLSRAADRA